jgi:glycosyltransferase involved in cell wall biosynthesis
VICYVGGISKIRGIVESCEAMGIITSNVRLHIAGNFDDDSLRSYVKTMPGWGRVVEMGYLDRCGVSSLLDRSIAGLVTLHPVPNYIDALPVKMFEYMCAGIPVIASDFPQWREIIATYDCGLLVDPLDPKAIATAIDFLVLNPSVARRMGANGYDAVMKFCNWGIEEEKLLYFYRKMLGLS